MRFNDAVFGVVLLLVAIAVAATALTFPGMPGQSFGPALFPDIIAGGFALCGLALIWSGVRQPEFPGVVQLTTDVLFRDLWLRPDLAPRDRSLVTVSALVATGQAAQVPYHLNRAMDGGLTQDQAAEAIAHLAFYAGWPPVFSAMPVARDVFEKRPK